MKTSTKRLLIIVLTVAVVFSALALTACSLLFGDGGGSGKNEYTITFVADGREVATRTYTDRDNSVGAPAVPAKKGYVGEWEPYTLHEQKNLTVNAVYTPKTFNLSLNYNGGSRDERFNNFTITYGQLVSELPQTSMDGYKFLGWYYGEELVKEGEEWIFDGSSTNLVARWRKSVTYNVSFYAEGQIVATIKYDTDDLTLYSPEPNVPAKKGYVGVWEDYELTPTSGHVRVNAVYTIKNYTVTLDYDGATGGNEQQTLTITYNDIVKSLPTPVKDGYAFRGWYVGSTRMDPGYTKWVWDDDDIRLVASWWDWSQGTEGLRYRLDGNSYTVTGIEMPVYKPTELIIPLLHDGKQVVAIEENAFYEDPRIHTIVIGDNVTTVGNAAFWMCTNVESVTFGNSVTTIGISAFYSCNKLTTVNYTGDLISWCAINFNGAYANPLTNNPNLYLNDNIVTTVVIPNGATSVGNYVFNGWRALTSVTIPYGVTTIGRSAFEGCTGLSSIDIPQSVTTIGQSAFASCSGITSVEIPNSVTTLGESAFNHCSALTEVTLHEGIEISAYSFSSCALTSIDIPLGVTAIGSGAFSNCTKLENVTLPQGVKTIGADAFNGCSALANVSIPDGVTTIGGYAFNRCSSFTSIVIPNSVTDIGMYAFNGCGAIDDVTLGSGVVRIGNYAFASCSVTTLHYAGNAEGWCNINFESANSNPACLGAELYIDGQLATTIIVPDSITEIRTYNFYQCATIEQLTLGDGVQTIAERSFYKCTNLTSVTMGNSVATVGAYAFAECGKLEHATLSNTLTELGEYAFYKCGLQGVTVPGSLAVVSRYAFAECSDLEILTLEGGVTKIDMQAFDGCRAFSSLVIPNSVTSIAESAFSNCSGLKSVTIGSGLTVLERYTFSGCAGLVNVNFGSGLLKIRSHAFSDCTGLVDIHLPDNITEIEEYAFENCSKLTNVRMSNGILRISTNSFSGCSNLKYNEYVYYVHYLGNENNPYLVAMKPSRKIDSFGLNVRFHDDTVIIAAKAFYQNRLFTTKPEEEILYLGQSLVAIGEEAFYYNDGYTTVNMPATVKIIDSRVFSLCNRLTTINFGGNCDQWNAIQKNSSWNWNTSNTIKIVCTDGTITA